MSGSFPLPTLAAQITATGISAPPYADILASLQASYRGIYGSDVYLEADSQDGQWLAVLAQAFDDANDAAIQVYNSRSPSTAQGAGLSSIVKINGLERNEPSNSTVDMRCIGQAGVTVTAGVVQDVLGQNWNIRNFVFPPGGDITVAATAADPGSLTAAPNTITKILNPTRGWNSATNPASATPGAPVEQDAQLRRRQAVSTTNNAQTPTQTLVGSILALSGVTACVPYENDTETTDGNGLPPHSIALVVNGGDPAAIATTIQQKKTEGGATRGTTTEVVLDYAGVPKTINLYRPTTNSIQVQITLTPQTGFTSQTETQIQQAVADYINALGIGGQFLGNGSQKIALTRLYGVANLGNAAASSTYLIEPGGIEIGVNGGSLGTADYAIPFNVLPSCIVTDVTLIT